MSILKIQQLQKNYGAIRAVDQLDLDVQRGQIFGLLGPNGSGKTTTLGIILDIICKDGGTYQWFDGQNQDQARKNIGALLETPNFYPYLHADDNLQIIAHIKGLGTTDFTELLELVNLEKRRQSPFRTYSLGMKQRLAIAATLVGNPEVLILDEPTNGLDPQGIAEVRNTITQIAQSGKTILLASHILDEVEKVCSHVAIIKQGRLLATGPVGAIINNETTVEVACADNIRLRQILEGLPMVKRLEEKGKLLVFLLAEGHDVANINKIAFEQGLCLTHLQAKAKSLEAEFLEITGKQGN